MATDRKAEVTWRGDLMSGSGRIDSVTSGAVGGLDVSWPARSDEPGGKTSPEELIAAAHATCLSMALSNGLAQAGHPPTKLETEAICTLDQTDGGFAITKMRLEVRGEVDGLDEEGFRKAAEDAKENCPVSKALAGNIELELDARLGS